MNMEEDKCKSKIQFLFFFKFEIVFKFFKWGVGEKLEFVEPRKSGKCLWN